MSTTRKTIAQTIIEALQARGFAIVPDASRKYTLLFKTGSSVTWVWVGRNGAARFANLKRFDASVPFSDRSRSILLAGRADNVNATAI